MSEAVPSSSTPASGGGLHPFEAILRMCAAASPKPWYPRVYAQSVGMRQEQLDFYLEHLWLDGLVQKAGGTPETGPGLTLTPAGLDVLNEPTALHRLKEGRPVVAGSQGGIVREAIRRPSRPTVTWALLAMNAAVFLYGLHLASAGVGVAAFLQGDNRILPILEILGGIRGDFWLQGQWWRLATSCFLHIGAMHILVNMYTLYRVGAEVEQMWGRVRFLVIYTFAGLGGSCLAVAMQPATLMAGASGALCGLIAAVAVWVLCNRRHLPRALASQMRNNLIINGVLLVFISLVPGVSGWGHLGGVIAGGVVALILQVQRFGRPPWRWLVLAGLIPLPWLGYALIRHEQSTNPEWTGIDARTAKQEEDREKERKGFEGAFVDRIRQETSQAYKVYDNEGGVLDHKPDARKPATVERVKQRLGEKHEIIKQLRDDLAGAGPYKDEETENARQAALRFADALDNLLVTAAKRLREGDEWTDADEANNKIVKDAAREWYKLLK